MLFATFQIEIFKAMERWIDFARDEIDEWPEADIAVLHVDLSVIPQAYAEAAGRYATVVNGAAPAAPGRRSPS